MGFWKEYKTDSGLAERLVGRKIIEWEEDYLKLDDGSIVTIEMTEYECCASAGGEFTDITLEAVITDIRFGVPEEEVDEDWYSETEAKREVVFIHNYNQIGKANMWANNGNGNYYYSVCAFKINDIYYAPLGSRGETLDWGGGMNKKDIATLAAMMIARIVKEFNFGLEVHKDGSLVFVDVNTGDRYKISGKEFQNLYDEIEVEEWVNLIFYKLLI